MGLVCNPACRYWIFLSKDKTICDTPKGGHQTEEGLDFSRASIVRVECISMIGDERGKIE